MRYHFILLKIHCSHMLEKNLVRFFLLLTILLLWSTATFVELDRVFWLFKTN